MEGTDGDDVILATDVPSVFGGGGDDTICVVLTSAGIESIVGAGPGDDLVDASKSVMNGDAQSFADVSLGSGADVYIGGPGRDAVDDGDREGAAKDAIRTGSGYNHVTVGSPGQAVTDDVDLGAGGTLRFLGDPDPSARFHVASHRGGLSLGTPEAKWDIDAANGILRSTAIGTTTGIAGFTSFEVTDAESVRFRGGHAAETLFVSDAPFDALMGGGADKVYVDPRPAATVGKVSGGPGSDTVKVDVSGQRTARLSIKLDLVANTLVRKGKNGTTRSMVDVENATVVGAKTVVLVGDEVRNRLAALGPCAATIDGGAGRDDLRVAQPGCPKQVMALRGGPGNDRLLGGYFQDLLLGGAGRDYAKGLNGIDTCVAEVRRQCER